jgi:hypothetical protein
MSSIRSNRRKYQFPYHADRQHRRYVAASAQPASFSFTLSFCHNTQILSLRSPSKIPAPAYFHLLIAYSAILTGSAFPGSSVLVQDSLGVRASSEHLPSLLTIMTHQHTSFSATSLCTQQHVAAYLLNGTLPTNGTVCPVDISLFPSANDTATTTRRNWLTRRRV